MVCFHSEDAGNISITASVDSIISNKIYIEDIYKYDPLTIDNNLYTHRTNSGTATITYNTNGVTITGTNTSDGYYDYINSLPSDYELSIDIITYALDGYGWSSDFGFENQFLGINNSNIILNPDGNLICSVPNTPFTLKIIVEDTTAKIYINNVLQYTKTNITKNHLHYFKTYNNRSTTFKNLKIREL